MNIYYLLVLYLLNKFGLNDNSVDIIQSEDVFEHIEYLQLKNNEVKLAEQSFFSNLGTLK